VFLLARIVRLITAVIVGFIVLGIVLHLFEANSGNAIVGFVYDVAGFFVDPFKGIFTPDGEKLRIAVNWGLAALIYGLVGALLSRLLAGAGASSAGARGRPTAI
jgi:hypothetical protein